MAEQRSSGTPSTFARFARAVSQYSGHPLTFVTALLIVVVWAVTGPLFHFSDTWQLVINTGTTIVTFLMVFLIQNTQNRDATAMHLKLDELIRVTREARNATIDTEELPEQELNRLRGQYQALATRARERAEQEAERAHSDPEAIIEEVEHAAVADTGAQTVEALARASQADDQRDRSGQRTRHDGQ